MKLIIKKAMGILSNISKAFNGTYDARDPRLENIRNNIIHKQSNGFNDDKKNIKSDMRNVGDDMRKSIEKYNLTHG
ncbi:MAG: hypothetical protein ACRC5A_07935 [Enterobacteriaceae bacterium]